MITLNGATLQSCRGRTEEEYRFNWPWALAALGWCYAMFFAGRQSSGADSKDLYQKVDDSSASA